MEFGEKLKALRVEKNKTQNELANELFVSRTAISKWESGNGFPSIDSLKLIASYFNVSVDSLLSNDEIIDIAKNEKKKIIDNYNDIVFGLLNLLITIFFFLPFFGYKDNGKIIECSLINLKSIELYIIIPYYVIIILIIILGILFLTLQNIKNSFWNKFKYLISIILFFVGTCFFMISLEPYAGSFTLVILFIECFLLYKKKMTR